MPAKPVSLSVVIITKDEERNIGRCLDSVAGVADEALVVDSYSTDRTKEIALEKGARFVEHPFESHVAQKNYAMRIAKHDIVLSLDADEALSDALRAAILQAKADWRADGYEMNRLTNYCGHWIRHSGWYPDRKLRLWDRRKGQWGGSNPHDRVEMQAGASVERLEGDLLHYSFYTISQHIRQIDFFTDIMAREAHAKGQKGGAVRGLVSGGFKFFKKYVLQQGFRDGYYGLVVCTLAFFYTFLKYVKLGELGRE